MFLFLQQIKDGFIDKASTQVNDWNEEQIDFTQPWVDQPVGALRPQRAGTLEKKRKTLLNLVIAMSFYLGQGELDVRSAFGLERESLLAQGFVGLWRDGE
ncbi:MAG TPA: hypothetical protein VNW30_06355 [Opitutaceae bacterium]|nr:hypothetical protein [Opitutaceae bacterium]